MCTIKINLLLYLLINRIKKKRYYTLNYTPKENNINIPVQTIEKLGK